MHQEDERDYFESAVDREQSESVFTGWYQQQHSCRGADQRASQALRTFDSQLTTFAPGAAGRLPRSYPGTADFTT